MWRLPEEEDLEIAYLSHLFDKMSESYKIFWFQAIVNGVIGGQTVFTYEKLLNEMIADAWYMVSEYRLNLGPADNLEALVHYARQTSGLKSSEKREKILEYLQSSEDKELKRKKRTLSLNVPYRLQAPFMDTVRGKEWNVSERKLVEKINREKRLMYYFLEIQGLQSRIEVVSEWREYIRRNQEILKGWIQYHLIQYLQRRNPNVPGISRKLYPPQKRNLERVNQYWRLLSEVMPVRDIYGDEVLSAKNITIDHFVPWSYVAHDELWNLSPTTRRTNSKKSNFLPVWDVYFPRLCEWEYLSYQARWKFERVEEEFERCRKEHINSDEVWTKLYREGLTKEAFSKNLEEILLPVYQSAHNMGFVEWKYQKGRDLSGFEEVF